MPVALNLFASLSHKSCQYPVWVTEKIMHNYSTLCLWLTGLPYPSQLDSSSYSPVHAHLQATQAALIFKSQSQALLKETLCDLAMMSFVTARGTRAYLHARLQIRRGGGRPLAALTRSTSLRMTSDGRRCAATGRVGVRCWSMAAWCADLARHSAEPCLAAARA